MGKKRKKSNKSKKKNVNSNINSKQIKKTNNLNNNQNSTKKYAKNSSYGKGKKRKKKNLTQNPSNKINNNESKKEEKKEQIQETKKESKIKISKPVIISIILIIFILLVIIGLFIFNLFGDKIQNNIYIENINVSKLTTNEALEKLNSEFGNVLEKKIQCSYNGVNYEINMQDIEFKYQTNQTVQDAFIFGKDKEKLPKTFIDFYSLKLGKQKEFNLSYEYNKEILKQKISEIEANFANEVMQYSYVVEQDSLKIKNGKDGIKINYENFENEINNIIDNNKFDEIINIPIDIEKAEKIDSNKIHSEVYVEMQNAFYTTEPFELHKEVRGVDFDVNSLNQMLATEPQKEEYEIVLNYTEPEIKVDDLGLYNDVLGSCSTYYVNNPNRTVNLRLAASKINGLILMPGESFSYNDVVGERTYAAGYRNAAIFVNGEVEDGLAGGICQISSTLYDAVVFANLEVTERSNHARVPSYLPAGKDATVYWGSKDFKFTNNRSFPVKLSLSVSNGQAVATIYGKRTDNEYDISLETAVVSRYNGYMVVNAYKVYRQNGVVVNRELVSTDSYKM